MDMLMMIHIGLTLGMRLSFILIPEIQNLYLINKNLYLFGSKKKKEEEPPFFILDIIHFHL